VRIPLRKEGKKGEDKEGIARMTGIASTNIRKEEDLLQVDREGSVAHKKGVTSLMSGIDKSTKND